jgi:uroporphyrinogen decarboxylase
MLQFSKNNKPLLWVMRQAGRYLPEYLESRKKYGSFMDLCFSSDGIKEVTMQPIERFNLSAAIIFSDILTIPTILNHDVKFVENIGPVITQNKPVDDLSIEKIQEKCAAFKNIYDGVSKVKETLGSNKYLIGFVGGPFTVASYMITKKSIKKDQALVDSIFQNKVYLKFLIDLIAKISAIHLSNQIKNGAMVVKIFESFANLVDSEDDYKLFVLDPIKYIVDYIKLNHQGVDVIVFTRCVSNKRYEDLLTYVKPDVIAFDEEKSIEFMKEIQSHVCVQGNLSPLDMFLSEYELSKKAEKLLNQLSDKPYIFNLGHGILPTTPVSSMYTLSKMVLG